MSLDQNELPSRYLQEIFSSGQPLPGIKALVVFLDQELPTWSAYNRHYFIQSLNEKLIEKLKAASPGSLATDISVICTTIQNIASLRNAETLISVSQFKQEFLSLLSFSGRSPERPLALIIQTLCLLPQIDSEQCRMSDLQQAARQLLVERQQSKHDQRRLCGCMLLASIDIQGNITDFFRLLWPALIDSHITTRQAAADALGRCLISLAKLPSVDCRIVDELGQRASEGLEQQGDTQHGSLLALIAVLESHLLSPSIINLIVGKTQTILRLFSSGRRTTVEVKSCAVQALPLIASEDARIQSGLFEETYGHAALDSMFQVCSSGSIDSVTTFPALGALCAAIPSTASQRLETVIELLRRQLTPQNGNQSFISEVLKCICYLAKGLPGALRAHVQTILDAMFAPGLSRGLKNALEVLMQELPVLRPHILARLLDHVSYVLSGSPYGSQSTATPCPPPSREDGAQYVPAPLFEELQAPLFVPPAQMQPGDLRATAVALSILADCDFSGYSLSQFVTTVLLPFCDEHSNARIRKLAVRAILRVVEGEIRRTDACINDLSTAVARLLRSCAADPAQDVRTAVLSGLAGAPPGFDPLLERAAPGVLQHILMAIQSVSTRSLTIRVFARVGLPAIRIPIFQSLLMQLVEQLRTGDDQTHEAAAESLCVLIETDAASIRADSPSVLAVLLQIANTRSSDEHVPEPSLLRAMCLFAVTADESTRARYAEPIVQFLVHALQPAVSSTPEHRLTSAEGLSSLARIAGPWLPPLRPTVIRALLQQLATEREERVRLATLCALGVWGAADPQTVMTQTTEEKEAEPLLEPESMESHPVAFLRAAKASLRVLLSVSQENMPPLSMFAMNAIIFVLTQLPDTRIADSVRQETCASILPHLFPLMKGTQPSPLAILHFMQLLNTAPSGCRPLLDDIGETVVSLAQSQTPVVALLLVDELWLSVPDVFRQQLRTVVPCLLHMIQRLTIALRHAPPATPGLARNGVFADNVELIGRLARTISLIASCTSISDYVHLIVPAVTELLLLIRPGMLLTAKTELVETLARIVSCLTSTQTAPNVIFALIEVIRQETALPVANDIHQRHRSQLMQQCIEALMLVTYALGENMAPFVHPVLQCLSQCHVPATALISSLGAVLQSSSSMVSLRSPPRPAAPKRQDVGVAALAHLLMQPDEMQDIHDMSGIMTGTNLYAQERVATPLLKDLDITVAQLLTLGLPDDVDMELTRAVQATVAMLQVQPSAPPSPTSSTDIVQPRRDVPQMSTPLASALGFDDSFCLAIDESALLAAAEIPATTSSTSVTLDSWLLALIQAVLEQCPCPAVRVVTPITRTHIIAARALFPAAYATLHAHIAQSTRDALMAALQAIMHMQDLSLSGLQSLLDFTEALEHDPIFTVLVPQYDYQRSAAATQRLGVQARPRRPAPPTLRDGLPIDSGLLAALSEKCFAYAKALHHKESQYLRQLQGRSRVERLALSDISSLESLIVTQNKLRMSDASRGLLVHARLIGLDASSIKETWLEELHCWDAALAFYRQRQTAHGPYFSSAQSGAPDALYEQSDALDVDVWSARPPSSDGGLRSESLPRHMDPCGSRSPFSFEHGENLILPVGSMLSSTAMTVPQIVRSPPSIPENEAEEFVDSRALLGELHCLISLSLHRRVIDRCNEVFSLLSDNHRGTAALYAAASSFHVIDDESLTRYLALIPRSSYFYHFYSAVLGFIQGDTALIREHTQAARRILDPRVQALAAESYIRSYSELIRVQQLVEMEEAADMLDHDAQTQAAARRDLIQLWRERLSTMRRDPDTWDKILSERRLAVPPREDSAVYVNFVGIATAGDRSHMAFSALEFLIDDDVDCLAEASLMPSRLSADVISSFTPVASYAGGRIVTARGVAWPHRPNASVAVDAAALNILELRRQCLDMNTPRAATAPSEDLLRDLRAPAPLLTVLGPADVRPAAADPEVEITYIRHAWHIGYRDKALRRLKSFASGLLDGLPDQQAVQMERPATAFANRNHRELAAEALMQLVDWNEQMSAGGPSVDTMSIARKAAELAGPDDRAQAWRMAAMSSAEVLQALGETADAHGAELLVSTMQAYCRAIESSTQKTSVTDTLRLFSLWIERGEQPEAERAIMDILSRLPVDVWLDVAPQILARAQAPEASVRHVIQEMLKRVAHAHPQALIFPLTVAAKAADEGDQPSPELVAREVLVSLAERQPALVEQALVVSRELIRVAILWPELWHEALYEATRMFYEDQNVDGSFERLRPLNTMLQRGGTTPSEVSFTAEFGSILSQADAAHKQYLATGDTLFVHYAWNLYYRAYQQLSQLRSGRLVLLDAASPQLLALRDLELACPDFYTPGAPTVRITSFCPRMEMLQSKQRPRKMMLMGSDGRDRTYLLKGHEDLRQDERAMQLFSLVNLLLAADPVLGRHSMYIIRYPAVPLSTHSGLIGWVTQTDTLHQLVKLYRESRGIAVNEESRFMYKMVPEYDFQPCTLRLEAFESAMMHTSGDDIHRILWLRASSSEQWLHCRVTFVRAVTLTSMVDYILGLGDRHPSNIMIYRRTGRVLHIDFGDSFEVAQRRERLPEVVPFRLTRLIIRALGPSGVEGDFRMTSQAVMELIRSHGSSVLAMLEAFIHDPLLTWRLIGHRARQSSLTATQQMHQEAERIIGRVRDKLSGKDFAIDTIGTSLNVPDQVARLIRQATSYEVLSAAYFGWMAQL